MSGYKRHCDPGEVADFGRALLRMKTERIWHHGEMSFNRHLASLKIDLIFARNLMRIVRDLGESPHLEEILRYPVTRIVNTLHDGKKNLLLKKGAKALGEKNEFFLPYIKYTKRWVEGGKKYGLSE